MRIPSSLAPDDQWRLARLAADGDAAARDALIESHVEGIRALAHAELGPTRAEEVADAIVVEIRRLYDDPVRGFEPNRGFPFGWWSSSIAREFLDAERAPSEDGDEVAPSEDPARDAQEGRLAPLAALCRGYAEGELDALTWLLAALDHGHPAGPWIDDLHERSILHADDDGLVTAAAHWMLAMRYLEGREGLTLDLVRARRHIALALERHGAFEALRTTVPPRWHPDEVAPRLDRAALEVLRAATPRPA